MHPRYGEFKKRLFLFLSMLILGCGNSSEWLIRDSAIVVAQRRVIEKKEPILFVFHDKNGDWQFLADENAQMDQIVELNLSDLIALDSSVTPIVQLKRGWKAQRTNLKSAWNISSCQ
jgi:hypothetical protein